MYQNQNSMTHNDEIDLYDLLEILIRQKMTIIFTTVLITAMAFVGALYIRSKNYNSEAINFRLKSSKILNDYYVKKANLDLDLPDYRDVLNSEENIDKLISIPEIKKLYEKNIKIEKRDFSSKKKFIEENFKIESVLGESPTESNKKVFRYYSAKAIFEGDKNAQRKSLNKYFEILNSETKVVIDTAIDKKEKEIERLFSKSEKQLIDLENKIREVSEKEAKIYTGKDNGLLDIINLKYQKLISDKNTAMETYNKYKNEALGIENIKKETNLGDIVQKESSFYEIKESSKAKLILVAGIILGIFSGVFLAFVKEFLDEFQKRKEKTFERLAV